MSDLDHGHAHHVPGGHAQDDHGLAKYIYVFVALCVLTSASVFTTSDYWPFHATPKVGWVFMMAVSSMKAMLVILFFMHVKYEANWKYVLTIPAAFMSIFLILMLVPDVGMRNRLASEERQRYMGLTPEEANAVPASLSNQSEGTEEREYKSP